MLVLDRKLGQQIRIGDDIVITVVKINNGHGHVRLGIEAPAAVPIWREEMPPERRLRLTGAEKDGNSAEARSV